jgi:hypothetical protein
MKTALKIFVAIGVIGLILLIIIPTIAWDGGKMAFVKITVLDDDTNRPISNATIILGDRAVEIFSLIDPKDRETFISTSMEVKRTDKTGTCTLEKMCRAGGGSGLFSLTGNYYLEGPLVIKSEKHREFRGLIQNSIGQKRFRLSKREHEITIYLEPLK